MTHDPATPDRSVHPSVTRRKRLAVLLAIPAVACLIIPLAFDMPSAARLAILFACMGLALSVVMLALPWEAFVDPEYPEDEDGQEVNPR